MHSALEGIRTPNLLIRIVDHLFLCVSGGL